MPAIVTVVPSGRVSSAVTAEIAQSATRASRCSETEQRVVGDVEPEHLALEGELPALVPLHLGMPGSRCHLDAGGVVDAAEQRVLALIASLRLSSTTRSTYRSWTSISPRRGVAERSRRRRP